MMNKVLKCRCVQLYCAIIKASARNIDTTMSKITGNKKKYLKVKIAWAILAKNKMAIRGLISIEGVLANIIICQSNAASNNPKRIASKPYPPIKIPITALKPFEIPTMQFHRFD